MIVSLLIAASDNEVIGLEGALPWHLPEDMRRFRRLTMGHVVVMGRLTYESIVARLGKPLPGRTSVVVSRAGAGPASDGQVWWAGSLSSALGLAEGIAASAGNRELFVGGGVSVYLDSLPFADRIYLTRVHQVVDGDRTMPAGWLNGFALVRSEPVSDPGATLAYEWLTYRRAPA
jgi:dihydrofolate reductase